MLWLFKPMECFSFIWISWNIRCEILVNFFSCNFDLILMFTDDYRKKLLCTQNSFQFIFPSFILRLRKELWAELVPLKERGLWHKFQSCFRLELSLKLILPFFHFIYLLLGMELQNSACCKYLTKQKDREKPNYRELFSSPTFDNFYFLAYKVIDIISLDFSVLS